MAASIKNWVTIELRSAPMARRMPISRVRSVTVTSMMFMMPMPPTSSEMAAMPPSTMLIMAACSLRVFCHWLSLYASPQPRSPLLVRPERKLLSRVTASSVASREAALTTKSLMLCPGLSSRLAV